MSQNDEIAIQCPNQKHTNNVKYICFDQSCQGERLYCIQCVQDGIHITHQQHQKGVPQLFEHISSVDKECDNLIIRMNKQMDLVYQDYYLLIGRIRSKYQISKQSFQNLNPQQMNSYLKSSVKFQQFQSQIQNLLEQYTSQFQSQMQNLLSELQLSELSYYQLSNFNINKSEELYQKGYKLYWNDKKFDEAIKILDQALNYNPKHQLSLWCKAECLGMLGQYEQAISWADKALEVNSKHCNSLQSKADSLRMLEKYNDSIIWTDKVLDINSNYQSSLYSKAECLRMLGQYEQAIIWADKALDVNSKHQFSLSTKSQSLRSLKKYPEAMKVIEESLNIKSNHFDSLTSKGKCLQEQDKFEEALKCYEEALKLDSNNQWAKDRKDECQKALNII